MKRKALLSILAAIVLIVIIIRITDSSDVALSEDAIVDHEQIENNDALHTEKEEEEKGILNGYTIVLDPGHGGNDGGAIGANGTLEKERTFYTAEKIAQSLKEHDANVQITRYGDEFVELASRVEIAERHNADLFISIHYDGFENADVNGITTYYYHDRTNRIAQLIHENIINKNTDARDRGYEKGDYYVLRENEIPGILLELGYITNPDDERRINSEDFQLSITEAVTASVLEFFSDDLDAGQASGTGEDELSTNDDNYFEVE